MVGTSILITHLLGVSSNKYMYRKLSPVPRLVSFEKVDIKYTPAIEKNLVNDYPVLSKVSLSGIIATTPVKNHDAKVWRFVFSGSG